MEEKSKVLDCEIIVSLQGFGRTLDSDGDTDEDEVKVGTDDPGTSLHEAIYKLGGTAVLRRKAGEKKAKKMKLWVPRNGEYRSYQQKDESSKLLKVAQLDGYERKQVNAYVTWHGGPPRLNPLPHQQQPPPSPEGAGAMSEEEAAPEGFANQVPQTPPPATAQHPRSAHKRELDFEDALNGGQELWEDAGGEAHPPQWGPKSAFCGLCSTRAFFFSCRT